MMDCRCPSCGESYRVSEDLAGTARRCTGCNTVFPVHAGPPALEGQPPTPRAAGGPGTAKRLRRWSLAAAVLTLAVFGAFFAWKQLRPAARALREGEAALTRGDLDLALSRFTEAVRSDPRSTEAFLKRALVLARKERFPEAIRDATEAIRLNPNLAVAYRVRGFAHMESRGAPREALSDLNEAIRLDPSDAKAYLYRGTLRGSYVWGTDEERSPAEAPADFDRASQLDPTLADAKFCYKRAECLFGLKRWQEAAADCERAARLDPSLAEADYLGGYIAWTQGAKDRATRLLERAASRNPSYRFMLETLRSTGEYPFTELN